MAELRRLGSHGPSVFPVALGCMGMSWADSDEATSIATIHQAVERGVNLLDTGDFYEMGHNEMLVGRAIRDRRSKVLLSVKFGAMRSPDNQWGGIDTRPAAVKNFAAYSLKRLGVDVIDVYRPARLDPAVPIEDTVGAIAELIQKGYVRFLGLSEMSAETVRRAHAVHPVSDLQIEYSLISRNPEQKIFPALEELGICATLYGVLSRGLLSGSTPGPKDFRKHFPRFSEENRAHNQRVVEQLKSYAAERGMSPAQLVIAWALAKQPRLIALIGARKPAQLTEALAAAERPLTPSEVNELEKLVPPDAIAGERYQAAQMAHLDSER